MAENTELTIDPRGTVAATSAGVNTLDIDFTSHVDAHATIHLSNETQTANADVSVSGTKVTITRQDTSKPGVAIIRAHSTKDGQPVTLGHTMTLMPAPAKTIQVTVRPGATKVDVTSVLSDVALVNPDADGRVQVGSAGTLRLDGGLPVFDSADGFLSPRGQAPERGFLMGHAVEGGDIALIAVDVTVIGSDE